MADSIATDFESVQKAFSKQAAHFDEDDSANPILVEWRKQVYTHVNNFLKPNSSILELNSGTGIDAVYFCSRGNKVHATDYSSGMIQKIQDKIKNSKINDLSCQQCSFESLEKISGKKFDYVFSNFGGLNCSSDLSRVTKQLPALLNKGAFVTWVIMPPICPWEILRIFKGKRNAFRRFMKGGTTSHLEGEYFQTYYFSLSSIKNAFGKNFRFIKTEAIGVTAPPPSAVDFVKRNSKLSAILNELDRLLRNTFPFNRWGDHIIVTFQYQKVD